jgi:hypothetical protein
MLGMPVILAIIISFCLHLASVIMPSLLNAASMSRVP